MSSHLRPTLLAALCCGVGLVAAHGAAQAQPSVSLYGLIDVSVGRTQAPGATASKGVDSGKMTTSFWGVKGSEDLGGGLKALFALESFMRSDTGASGRIDPDAAAERKTLSLGYDHFVSKRTDLYAVWMSDKVDGLSGATSYSLGVRHRF